MSSRSLTGLIIGASLAIIILLCFHSCNLSRELKAEKAFYEQPLDSMTQQRLKDSTQLTTLRARFFTQDMLLHSKDSLILAMKSNLPDKGKGLQEYIGVKTRTTGSIRTNTKDTSIKRYRPSSVGNEALNGSYYSDTPSLYPYNEKQFDLIVGKKFTYDNGFLSEHGLIYGDSVDIDYEYKGDFTVQAFMKGKDAYVNIHSLDPHTTVTNLDYYKVSMPKKKIWQTTIFKVGAGIVIGGVGMHYINH